jgi:glutamate N-acetyltransferase/amino-acid N-acetyltransferase
LENGKVISPVKGILLNALSAGIYKKQREDLVLIQCEFGSSISAVFTKNAFCAAPVIISRNNLNKTKPVYFLINAGNANAGTGKKGIDDALGTAISLSDYTGCHANEVLLFSTGVIGEYLPVEKIKQAIPALVDGLAIDKWFSVSKAIMTTDTRPKIVSKSIRLNEKDVTITGIAKGSGMIKPDMATLLSFIGTDASVEQSILDDMLYEITNVSFNRITVDGDTSTNDACVLIASGSSGSGQISSKKSDEYHILYNALEEVCIFLAKEIVRDGEGATKFITLDIVGGHTTEECITVADNIAQSPLVKTALFASDPNWGRILAAVGRSSIDELKIEEVNIFVDDLCIVSNGEKSAEYTEEKAADLFKQTDITIRVEMNRGKFKTRHWTCDLSYDYVKINAEYRT